ncbi:MAG: YgiT-type zinc finger protein [Proteobacteria bacterium]|nr:YgiT-type zinc finger protein [Pseudomonadota bacterium]
MPYEISNEHMVVIKDVPALICRQCGELLLKLKHLELLKELSKTLKKMA